MKLTKTDMLSIINAVATRYALSTGGDKQDFMCGKCDAFALGLQDALVKFGLACSLTLISRTTTHYIEPDDFDDVGMACTDDVDYVDTNDFCHVVVNFLAGEWDIGGDDASERYENDWYDESHQQTEFEYKTTDERELLSIRAAKEECLDQETRFFVTAAAEEELRTIVNRFAGTAKINDALLMSHG